MISTAIAKGNYVYVYDEHNHLIGTLSGELYGYTSTTCSVKRRNYIYTYDENRHLVSTKRI